jgi:tRNA A-37 threonylcarbamoyl transferase component Bud32
MKILKQQPVKSYRAKQIDKFLDKHFPIKEIRIPSEQEIKIAVLKQVASEKGKRW